MRKDVTEEVMWFGKWMTQKLVDRGMRNSEAKIKVSNWLVYDSCDDLLREVLRERFGNVVQRNQIVDSVVFDTAPSIDRVKTGFGTISDITYRKEVKKFREIFKPRYYYQTTKLHFDNLYTGSEEEYSAAVKLCEYLVDRGRNSELQVKALLSETKGEQLLGASVRDLETGESVYTNYTTIIAALLMPKKSREKKMAMKAMGGEFRLELENIGDSDLKFFEGDGVYEYSNSSGRRYYLTWDSNLEREYVESVDGDRCEEAEMKSAVGVPYKTSDGEIGIYRLPIICRMQGVSKNIEVAKQMAGN